MILIILFAAISASETERRLHAQLFDPEVYNPKVIQDSWRKANRNDYSSIGAFAKDKCTGRG